MKTMYMKKRMNLSITNLLKVGLLSLMLFVLIEPTAKAQGLTREAQAAAKVNEEFTMRGRIISVDDGLPLVNAYVIIKGTTKGTMTDTEGRFELPDVKKGDVLVFSYVGMETQEYVVTESTDVSLDIKMELSDDIMMGELISINVYEPQSSAVKRFFNKVKSMF